MIQPAWSADGLRIAYCAVTPSSAQPDAGPADTADIWVVGVDGSGRMRLTDGQNTSFSPVWSGTDRLYFTSAREGCENVWSLAPSVWTPGATEQRTALGETADSRILQLRMQDILAIRGRKQPLEYPSCGSVFKRPPGYYAGSLIEQADLKGVHIGGAMVSPKHAGFILNTNNATAADVYALIRLIERRVYERFGVRLEREVKLIGNFVEYTT